MRRHITLLAALALAVSMGCAKSAPHKMGAAGPPPGRIIPVGYDPSVSGLSGAVGEVVYVSGGTAAWVRTGVNNTDWQAFPGSGGGVGGAGGLTSVTTDSTLAGNGTLGSPLGVNPVAARAPDWFGYMAVLFQENGGISPLAFSCMIVKDFADNGLTTSQQGMQSAGTGAGTVYTNISGGVIKATGATSGSGYADYASAPQSQSPWSFLPNLRTKRWMAAYRLAIGKTPTSASSFSVGVYDAGNAYIGLGYSGAQTNWQYTRGATPTNLADTGKAITVDATGLTSYLTMAVANFDLSHVSYNVDVLSSATFVNAESVTNIPNNSGFPYIYNEGVAAGDIYFLDKVIVCGEM